MVNLVPLKKWKTTKDDVGARNKRDRGGRFSSACVSIPCAPWAHAQQNIHTQTIPRQLIRFEIRFSAKRNTFVKKDVLKTIFEWIFLRMWKKLKTGGIIVESREKPAFAGGSDCDGGEERRRGNCRLIGSVRQLGTDSAARKRWTE